MARFFKKFMPQTPVVVDIEGKPTKIQFDSADGVIGYYGSEKAVVTDQLAKFIELQRYGLTEVTAEEYMAEYAEKKTQPIPSKSVWREELSRSGGVGLVDNESGRLGSESVQRAIAVENRTDIRPTRLAPQALVMGEHLTGSQPSTSAAAPAEQKKEELKVNVGPRRPQVKNANNTKARS